MRTLRSSAFGVDNGSRKRNALTAFRLTTERAIGLTGADGAVPRRSADILFPNGIADADDHVTLSLDKPKLRRVRVIRNSYCVTFANQRVTAPPAIA